MAAARFVPLSSAIGVEACPLGLDRAGLGGEVEEGHAVRPGLGQGLGQVILGGLARVVADAQAPVDREDDELIRVVRSKVKPARASTEQDDHQRPAGQRQDLLPAGEVDEAPDEIVDDDGHDRQAEEPGGAGQLEGEPGGLGHLS